MFKNLLTAICLIATPAIAWADGDPAKGEKVFKKCKACHAVGDGAKHKVGPELNGVIGRTVAGAEGFKYSDVLKALGDEGKTWTAEELSAFLTKPRDYAKGTKMSFAGLRKEDDRINVIAYLDTFSEGGS